jgi:membrane protease subunit HflK
VRDLIQHTLDSYGAGINIVQVQMQKVDPPEAVIESFRDVQAARADKERAINEALAYRNKVVPEARGKAEQIRQEAQAYREQMVAQAQGEAQRFTAILAQYQQAKTVTRERMYLETMERVLGRIDKVVIDDKSTSGVVPYLPLDALKAPKGTLLQGDGQAGEGDNQ